MNTARKVIVSESEDARILSSLDKAKAGAALIGLAEGEIIAWPIPGGKLRKLQVVAVEQPGKEAGSP